MGSWDGNRRVTILSERKIEEQNKKRREENSLEKRNRRNKIEKCEGEK